MTDFQDQVSLAHMQTLSLPNSSSHPSLQLSEESDIVSSEKKSKDEEKRKLKSKSRQEPRTEREQEERKREIEKERSKK